MAAIPIDVRFTPKSGHGETPSGYPLCAKSGLMRCSNQLGSLLDNVVRPARRASRRRGQSRIGVLRGALLERALRQLLAEFQPIRSYDQIISAKFRVGL